MPSRVPDSFSLFCLRDGEISLQILVVIRYNIGGCCGFFARLHVSRTTLDVTFHCTIAIAATERKEEKGTPVRISFQY